MSLQTDKIYTHDVSDPPAEEMDIEGALSALATIRSTTTLPPSELIKLYLALVCRLTGVHTAFVSCLTPQTMCVRELHSARECPVLPVGVLLLEDSFCQYVWTTRSVVVIPDATHDPRVVDVSSRKQLMIGAYLGVPVLMRDGGVYGSLCAVDPEARSFTQMQIDVLRIIAQDIALLIEHEAADQQTLAPPVDALPLVAEHATDVFRMVVHDLRTPIAGVTGYADLLAAGGFGALTSDQQEALDQIRTAMRFMHRLVNDLVDVAAADTHMLLLVREVFAPASLVEQVVAVCQTQAAQQGLTLEYSVAEAPASMTGDPERLRQVLLNLLGNALRYTVTGGMCVEVTSSGEMVEFHVIDSGPGIPVDVQAQVWDEHVRRSEEGAGLGLGLHIVRRLVVAMGGMVEVQSRPGNGCRFVVRLPLHGPQPQRFAWS